MHVLYTLTAFTSIERKTKQLDNIYVYKFMLQNFKKHTLLKNPSDIVNMNNIFTNNVSRFYE